MRRGVHGLLVASLLLSTRAGAQSPQAEPAPASEEPTASEAPTASAEENPPPPDQPATTDGVTQACTDAFDRSQDLRGEGKLLEARKQLLACAQPGCLDVVRAKCVEWLGEVNGATPTLVVSLERADGAPANTDAIELDGRLVSDVVIARAFSVDPGPHVLRVRVGERWLKKRVNANAGQKNLAVDFVVPVEARADEPTEAGSKMPRLQVAGLATGIPGLAALAVFGILGGVGVSKEKSLREQCAPDCDSSQVRGVERLYFGADLAFTIGGICTLTGATMYLVGRLTEPDEASVGLQLRAAPSEVALVGSF